jgi:hypothetical protein
MFISRDHLYYIEPVLSGSSINDGISNQEIEIKGHPEGNIVLYALDC